MWKKRRRNLSLLVVHFHKRRNVEFLQPSRLESALVIFLFNIPCHAHLLSKKCRKLCEWESKWAKILKNGKVLDGIMQLIYSRKSNVNCRLDKQMGIYSQVVYLASIKSAEIKLLETTKIDWRITGRRSTEQQEDLHVLPTHLAYNYAVQSMVCWTPPLLCSQSWRREENSSIQMKVRSDPLFFPQCNHYFCFQYRQICTHLQMCLFRK